MDSSPVTTFKVHDHLNPRVSEPIQFFMPQLKKMVLMDVRMSMFVDKECCVSKLPTEVFSFNCSCVS
jgi:hypothetical protein